jgi:hypothetical protein
MGHILLAWAVLFGSSIVYGQHSPEPQLLLVKTPSERASELKSRRWIEVIEREVPPLTHDPGSQMPMIMWHGVGFQPLSPAEMQVLRQRGLNQHLQLSASMIPAAQALQSAKLPVILMEGRTDSWPYSLAKDATSWPHEFDDTYLQARYANEDETKWHGACPHRIDGWTVLAEQTKQTLQKFRDAGVKVDAVWVDYEGDPYPWKDLYEQLQHCKRCRRELPAEIIQDEQAWRNYCWQKYVQLYDQHFAKPVREVFPDCLVTNWHVVFSGQVEPVRYFVRNVLLPELRPEHFNVTNPIAYGSDLVWRELWNPAHEITQQSVDDFYAEQIKQQVAADRRNRIACGATSVQAIPWVARVSRIAADESQPVPVMSRDRYRETLGELWDMKIHSMQIFNAMHAGYEELAITELQDAVAAYDAMLAREQ